MRSDRRTTVAALYVAQMPRGDWSEGLSSFEAKKRILVGTFVVSYLNGYIIRIDSSKMTHKEITYRVVKKQ